MQFRIENMTCGGCAKSVSRAITNLDPNAKVDATPASRTVKIETSVSQAQVQEALAAAGFPATED